MKISELFSRAETASPPNTRPENSPPSPLLSSLPTSNGAEVSHDHVVIDGECYLRMGQVDQLAPFFMSLVGDSAYWLFAGSNTSLTAGRGDPDGALFPYLCVDRILQAPEQAGVLTVFLVEHAGHWMPWEPWHSPIRNARLTRNLYKHELGTDLIFEEIHHDLELRFRWTLSTCESFGLVRQAQVVNLGPSPRRIRYLDGWNQLLPPGIGVETWSRLSYLAAGYMRHECLPDSVLGIFTLNSGITDRAEPSESLQATAAWSLGHAAPVILLSRRQIERFRAGHTVAAETEVRGDFAAYLVADAHTLGAGQSHAWWTVADTQMDHSALLRLADRLRQPGRLKSELTEAVAFNRQALRARIAAADGVQRTADRAASVHHFANTLYNCMRGGTFPDGYRTSRRDFLSFLRCRNRPVHDRHAADLQRLPETLEISDPILQEACRHDVQLTRLTREYLPLTFSRRHGDPSRPWNRFSIAIKDNAGLPLYGYQGNWRDIFQNWEGLGQSYPGWLRAMITVFLNASTADGYNPYRITREGVDWEVHDPADPWNNIGYWGDHQIIYLLRLLESCERFTPGSLADGLREEIYTSACVPYRIADWRDLLVNPRASITFDQDGHEKLMARAAVMGGDGKLAADPAGQILCVSLIEKLLVPLLAKLSNFVPEGGIWLNTQRPEWNDANNALAGWGLSLVTVCHLRRYLIFLDRVVVSSGKGDFSLSSRVADFLSDINAALHKGAGVTAWNDHDRWSMMEALGQAGERHRRQVYEGEATQRRTVSPAAVRDLIATALPLIDQCIVRNHRSDGLYHSYNLLHLEQPGQAAIAHLYPMLEGQVAVLSSTLLDARQSLGVLESLRSSDLYRADQNSYLLYPDRAVPSFLARNTLPADAASRAPSLARLLAAGCRDIVVEDDRGGWHFESSLTNANDLRRRLEKMETAGTPGLATDRAAILDLWEATFHHSAFTGRSGTMFSFEGLGSIYWHMVAKLLLAVQETFQRAETTADPAATEALAGWYEAIRAGLGFTKTPAVYGAFPSDPYSHSPRERGAQQPGMTGQVKEELLTRWGELGVQIAGGCLSFRPRLLQASEFFTPGTAAASPDSPVRWEAGGLDFTYCHTPIRYVPGETAAVSITRHDGSVTHRDSCDLGPEDSAAIFHRDGTIRRLTITVPAGSLRGKVVGNE